MIYLTSASTEGVRAEMRRGELGAMMSPDQGYHPRHFKTMTWAADNGCFSDSDRDLDRHLFWLARFTPEARDRCLFAVAMDVVADPIATTERFGACVDPFRTLGYKVAYVAQNGLEDVPHLIPWDDLDCFFLGGLPNDDGREWKISPPARALAVEAKERGKWVHMGRVNSRRRFLIASAFCDSADGTYVGVAPNVNMPKARAWVRESEAQGVLL